MAWTFEATRAGYGKLWREAFVKAGADDNNADLFANKIIAAEQRYRTVQAATGVPWYFIGALHMRESSCNFEGVLHNGEKIIGTGRLTTLVPAGRGPFASWEESATDALKLKDLHRVQDWPVERMLYSAEVFNGLGYVGKGVNSPYVWAGTTKEQPGKYVRDHVFDPGAEDTQLGVAAVLKRLAEKRPDIAADLFSDGLPPAPQLPEILPPLATGAPNNLLPVLLSLLVAVMQQRQQPGGAPASQPDILAQLLEQLAGGKIVTPIPPPPPPPPPPPAPEPAPTTVNRPSVQLSIGALVASILGMVGGQIGTPFGMGEAPTTAGTLSVVGSVGSALIGATGGWGALASIGMKLVGALAGSIANRAK